MRKRLVTDPNTARLEACLAPRLDAVTTDSLNGNGFLGEDLFIEAADGRRLRAMLSGQGEDLVGLEAGLGASGLY